MAKAGAKPKKMTKKEQSERFKQTARKLGANDSVEDFEVNFRKLVPPRRRPKIASGG
jgi:hypothetical protein